MLEGFLLCGALLVAIMIGFLGLGVYLLRCGDALSQLINVVIFLSDNPNESLSGRSYRQLQKQKWKLQTKL